MHWTNKRHDTFHPFCCCSSLLRIFSNRRSISSTLFATFVYLVTRPRHGSSIFRVSKDKRNKREKAPNMREECVCAVPLWRGCCVRSQRIINAEEEKMEPELPKGNLINEYVLFHCLEGLSISATVPDEQSHQSPLEQWSLHCWWAARRQENRERDLKLVVFLFARNSTSSRAAPKPHAYIFGVKK